MKVAYCLSGEPRFVRDGFHLNNLFLTKNREDGCEIDVYVHTWYDYAREGQWRNDFYKHKGQHNKQDLEDVIQLYRPKAMRTDVPFDFSVISDGCGIGEKFYHPYLKHNVFSMFKGIELSNQLVKDSGVEYDCVVRARFDFVSSDAILLSKFSQNQLNRGTDQDNFAFGNPKVMDWYSDAFYHIRQIHLKEEVHFYQEPLLTFYLEKNNPKFPVVNHCFKNFVVLDAFKLPSYYEFLRSLCKPNRES